MFTFQFLNDKVHNYVFFDIIVYFVIQKLKSKRSSLKNIQTEQNYKFSLVLSEREEKKPKYFAPQNPSRLLNQNITLKLKNPMFLWNWQPQMSAIIYRIINRLIQKFRLFTGFQAPQNQRLKNFSSKIQFYP